MIQEKHHIHIHWTFFATYHGKGPVDGIGGAVKRYVWTAVKQRKEIVVNRACSFIDEAGGMPHVGVLEMTTGNIEHRQKKQGPQIERRVCRGSSHQRNRSITLPYH